MKQCRKRVQAQVDSAIEELTRLFGQMKFQKKWVGGVDEQDVWKKMEQLQQTYEQLYQCQAAYYQALLRQQECLMAQQRGQGDGGACG